MLVEEGLVRAGEVWESDKAQERRTSSGVHSGVLEGWKMGLRIARRTVGSCVKLWIDDEDRVAGGIDTE